MSSGRRRVTAWGAALAGAILLPACGAGSSGTTDAGSSPGTSSETASPSASASVRLDPGGFTKTSDRDTQFEGVRVQLAGAPYECLDPQQVAMGGFSSLVPCAAVVHAQGPGLDDDWLASNGIALAVPDLVDSDDDLAAASSTVLNAFLHTFYDPAGFAKPVTLSRGPTDVPGATGQAYRRVVRIPVHRKDLQTTSDTVELVLVKLTSGRYVAWWSVLPNDADPADATLAAASLHSLTVVA